MAAVGSFYLLSYKHVEQGRIFVRLGVIAGLIVSVLQLYPTGDWAGRMVAEKQPVTLAAMEALFDTHHGAPLVIIGQPDVANRTIDNPILVPKMLSFLTYRRWNAEVKGLNEVPERDWPQNIPLLYFAYHIMVGLGTLFIAVMGIAALLLWRRKLYDARWMLWLLMLMFPLPYIANTHANALVHDCCGNGRYVRLVGRLRHRRGRSPSLHRQGRHRTPHHLASDWPGVGR